MITVVIMITVVMITATAPRPPTAKKAPTGPKKVSPSYVESGRQSDSLRVQANGLSTQTGWFEHSNESSEARNESSEARNRLGRLGVSNRLNLQTAGSHLPKHFSACHLYCEMSVAFSPDFHCVGRFRENTIFPTVFSFLLPQPESHPFEVNNVRQ